MDGLKTNNAGPRSTFLDQTLDILQENIFYIHSAKAQ